jgi:hypothetical protein
VKFVAVFLLLAGSLGLLLGVYACGWVVGSRRSWAVKLRDLELHSGSARLHSRAIKLLRRLDATTDLDGAMAGDILSPETKDMVADWVADHRRELLK